MVNTRAALVQLKCWVWRIFFFADPHNALYSACMCPVCGAFSHSDCTCVILLCGLSCPSQWDVVLCWVHTVGSPESVFSRSPPPKLGGYTKYAWYAVWGCKIADNKLRWSHYESNGLFVNCMFPLTTPQILSWDEPMHLLMSNLWVHERADHLYSLLTFPIKQKSRLTKHRRCESSTGGVLVMSKVQLKTAGIKIVGMDDRHQSAPWQVIELTIP